MDKDKETIKGSGGEDAIAKQPRKKSIGRTIWIWFRRSVLTIFILVIGSLIALQLPVVQTWLARQLSAYLKSNYNLEVKIDRVNINLFNKTVSLSEVLVGDHHGDTIIHGSIIKLDIANIYPGKGYIDVKRVVLENGYVNIRTYKDEKTPNITQFINTLKGDPNKKKKKKKGKPWVINMSTVVLDECNVRVRNENQKILDAEFLPSDIRIYGIGGKVGNFQIRGDTLEMDVDNLRAFEGSGIALKKFSSHVVISSKELTFKGFKLNTYKSTLGGYFSMRYANWRSFSHFNDSVFMIADLDMSDINASDLAYFTNNLKGIDFDFRFKGGVTGTLSHLKSEGFSLYFGHVSQMVGEIELIGLPNIDSTWFGFQVKKLTTDAIDLATIPIPPFYKKQRINIPPQIKKLGIVKYEGHLKGTFSDLHIDGFATTKIGNADLDMHLWKKSKNDDYQYKGKIDAQQFNVGTLANTNLLGKVTFNAQVDGKGFDFKKGYVHFDGKLKQFEFNGYNYRNITADAKYGKNIFEGIVDIKDSNANIEFVGIVDLNNIKIPKFDFSAQVNKLDLVAVKLIKNKKQAILSTVCTANMEGKTIDDLVGQIRICGTDYLQDEKLYHMETLILNSFIRDSTKTIDLHSDVVNAKFSGQFTFIPLINEIKRQITHVAPSLKLTPDEKIDYTPQNFYFYIVLSHPELITQILAPDLTIADQTVIEGRLGSKDNYLSLEVNAPKVKYKQFAINEWFFLARNKNEKLRIHSDAKTVHISDSTKVDNFNMTATALNDSLDLWVGFQNEESNLNGASINILTYFGNAPEYTFNIHDSYFYFNDSIWKVNNNNKIVLNKSSIYIENISINSDGRKIPILTLNGRCSESDQDKITATLNYFPLAIVNGFIPTDKVKLEGNMVGDIDVYKLLQKPYFTSSLAILDTKLNDILIGNLGLKSEYDPVNQGLTINSKLVKDGKNVINIHNGKIKLNSKQDAFDLKADIDGLDLSAFEKLANPVFTNLQGKAYGTFSLTGSFSDPQLNTMLNLQGAGLRLAYLNAYFNFDMDDKKISINNSTIRIPLMRLTDRYGNNGTLKGRIDHQMFKKIFLDIKLESQNMCVMETTEKDNEQFYGKAYATGKATIIGPIEDIVVVANLTTEKNTVLNIPITSRKSVKENNFVVFVNPKDTVEVVESKPEEKGNFTLNLNVKATPEAKVRIIFDETVGDVISCNGQSDNINLTLDTKGRFTMLGTYEITKGDYLFTLRNLINKSFTIRPGSNIIFTGDPYDAIVNATAVYRANASIYPIVSSFLDPTEAEKYKKASKVDCELTITNTLADLLIGFNFSLPNTDQVAASIVKSTLNTQEEMNRQVFSLLVLNQFLPLERGSSLNSLNTTNATSSLGSSSLELISGQLNNWLSKITQDVNIDLRYNTGNTSNGNANDQVSVALSTQFFNDRLIIDGDFGVGIGSTTSTTKDNIAGNVSVELKLTNDGKLRLRAFNKVNDNQLVNPQYNFYTQGIGINYKVEFDSWGDLFKKKKKKSKGTEIEKTDTLRKD